jgi:hypothetical protein
MNMSRSGTFLTIRRATFFHSTMEVGVSPTCNDIIITFRSYSGARISIITAADLYLSRKKRALSDTAVGFFIKH